MDPAGLSNCPGMISSRVNEYTEFKNGKDWSECSGPRLMFNILLGMSTLQWIKRKVGIGNWPGGFPCAGSHCDGFQLMCTL